MTRRDLLERVAIRHDCSGRWLCTRRQPAEQYL